MDWERLKMERLVRKEPRPGPLDWMDWERRKTLRLILNEGA
jgi:hypothetical protein